jgi:CBS domain-containing protein
MNARELMTKEIEICTLNDTAQKAGEIMQHRNCGFVPVVRDSNNWFLEGVLTDRDIALYLCKTNKRPSEIKVGEFCTRRPKTVTLDTEIHEVEKLMEDAQIHRIPVVGQDGKLAGVISLKNLAETAWKGRKNQFPEVTEKEIGEIVEAIAISR